MVLLNARLGNAEHDEKVKDLLCVSSPLETDEPSELLVPYLLFMPAYVCGPYNE